MGNLWKGLNHHLKREAEKTQVTRRQVLEGTGAGAGFETGSKSCKWAWVLFKKKNHWKDIEYSTKLSKLLSNLTIGRTNSWQSKKAITNCLQLHSALSPLLPSPGGSRVHFLFQDPLLALRAKEQ